MPLFFVSPPFLPLLPLPFPLHPSACISLCFLPLSISPCFPLSLSLSVTLSAGGVGGGVERGSDGRPSLMGRETAVFGQSDAGAGSKATMGAALTDGAVVCIWAFPNV